ncbi:MAG: fimbrillin family protein [Tidjanibacter sp.]|nr:fimbrillin family protein [Tidjanibacter sp.]
MKKLMIIALGAAVALTSCLKNNYEDISAPEEISFKSFNLGENTRADFTHDYFRAYAQFSNKGDGSDYKDFWGAAAKKIVKKNDGSADYWAAEDGTYYWPKAGAISFWGYYYPEDQTSVNLSLDTNVGIKGTDVTAAQAALIMLAKPEESRLKTANTVKMLFRHVGSQVVFRFANASIDNNFALTINKVEITEAMNKGNFTYADWSDYEEETTYQSTQSYAVNNKEIGTDNAYTFSTLPQALAESGAKKYINVYYRVADNNAGYEYEGVYTAEATDWKINTIHYYNITFDFTKGGEIKFAPEVEDWTPEFQTYGA